MAEFSPATTGSPLWRLLSPRYRAGQKAVECGLAGCTRPGLLTCSACQEAGYCGREHQRAHWPAHRAACCPFRLERSGGAGRHLVATRNIRPGEVILSEPPLTAGPSQYTRPLCLGCHTPASLAGPRCDRCGW